MKRRAQPQQELSLPAPPPPKARGGKRPGAGRPRKRPRYTSRPDVPHVTRPVLKSRYPVHVVLRAIPVVGNLRRRKLYHAIRWATLCVGKRENFRIVHLSIQRTHIHLLVEAADKTALARGMQGFQISAAKLINAALHAGKPGPRRRGTVFPDRYHATIIKSPRQARHALSYVLNNWRKHGEDRNARLADWKIDWFSSAISFPWWTEYGDSQFMWRGPPGYEQLWCYRPRTWLLDEGWKIYGATISSYEVPSAATQRGETA
jgi:hypothetical protein